MASASQIEPSKHFVPYSPSLLGIPGELRNKIYRYALVEPEKIRLGQCHCCYLGLEQPFHRPGLLRTSRQLRDEAEDIYYKENTFSTCVWRLSRPHPGHWVYHKGVTVEIQDPGATPSDEYTWSNFKMRLKQFYYDALPTHDPGNLRIEHSGHWAPAVWECCKALHIGRAAGKDWKHFEAIIESDDEVTEAEDEGLEGPNQDQATVSQWKHLN